MSSAVQCKIVQNSAVQCSAEKFSAVQCSAVQKSSVQFGRDLGARDREAVWSMLTWGGGRMVTSLEQSVTHLLVTLPLGEQYNMALAKVKTIRQW